MLRGHLDAVSRQQISGWTWNSDEPDTPATLVITANDEVIGRVLANRYRSDLKEAGIGNGRFGFELLPGPRLLLATRYVISARREFDGSHLSGSPAILEASTAFDETMAAQIANVLGVVETDADLERRLAFLAEQTQQLLQIRADRSSRRLERTMRRRHRWQGADPTGGPAPEGVRDVDGPPRALFIDNVVPRPGHDAGSNAILSHMESMKRLGFAVAFAPANLDSGGSHIEAAGIDFYARPWVSSVEEILTRQADSFELVYLHRAAVATRYAAMVRHYQPRTRLVYSVADLHFLRLARQADIEERPELVLQSRVSQSAELMAAWYADAVITHSSFEGALLAQRIPPAKVHVVPWAVSCTRPASPFAERLGMAFIGGYAHQPNVDAARWLVGAVMPALAALDPTIPCLLVGSDMPGSLRQLTGGNVEAVGAVSGLSEVFDRVRLTVAPLAFGAGIKGKVLDSLAAGVPCVCTPAAAEGLDLPPLLMDQVGSTPAELAGKIERLHNDEALNARCAEAALAYAEAFASERRIDALMRKVAGTAAPRVDTGR